MARFGLRCTPWVTTWLLKFSGICLPCLSNIYNSDLALFAGALRAPANSAGLGGVVRRSNLLIEKGARFKIMSFGKISRSISSTPVSGK
jgi:hypothetical protein